MDNTGWKEIKKEKIPIGRIEVKHFGKVRNGEGIEVIHEATVTPMPWGLQITPDADYNGHFKINTITHWRHVK